MASGIVRSGDKYVFTHKSVTLNLSTAASGSVTTATGIDSDLYDVYCVSVGTLGTTNTQYATIYFSCTISGNTATISAVRQTTGSISPTVQCVFMGIHK